MNATRPAETAPAQAPVPAVILARGLGSRMRRADGAATLDAAQAAAADAGLKAMVPVGRPLIEHALASFAEAGVRDVVLVIGPEHDAVRRHLTEVAPPAALTIRFAVQAHPLGTADAIVAAADVLGERSFLVGNGDNLYPASAWRSLLACDGAAVVAFDRDRLQDEGGIESDRLRAFAVLAVRADDTLADIVEKPGDTLDLAAPSARWIGMNAWRITPAIVAACRRVLPSARGELELPEAVRDALAAGLRVTVCRSDEAVLDLSHRRDVAAVAARLADRVPRY